MKSVSPLFITRGGGSQCQSGSPTGGAVCSVVELQGEALCTQMSVDLWIGSPLAPSHRILDKDTASEICMRTVDCKLQIGIIYSLM